MDTHIALLAVGTPQQADGSAECFATVGGFADEQVTVFGGAGEHI